ncbi:MAG: hypothetical protein M1536_09290 [Firmicutes bacterium]|nr:hypothetical protein [Bacillota bacterium]
MKTLMASLYKPGSRKGFTLPEIFVSMAIVIVIGVLLLQFYLLMKKTFNQISVHSDLQRTERQISRWMVSEVREACPDSTTTQPILMPNSSQPTSTYITFTKPLDLSQPRNPTFQTIQYYYDSNSQKLLRKDGSGLPGRVIASDISSFTFTWVSDFTVKVNLTLTKTIENRIVTSGWETYITTRYNI